MKLPAPRSSRFLLLPMVEGENVKCSLTASRIRTLSKARSLFNSEAASGSYLTSNIYMQVYIQIAIHTSLDRSVREALRTRGRSKWMGSSATAAPRANSCARRRPFPSSAGTRLLREPLAPDRCDPRRGASWLDDPEAHERSRRPRDHLSRRRAPRVGSLSHRRDPPGTRGSPAHPRTGHTPVTVSPLERKGTCAAACLCDLPGHRIPGRDRARLLSAVRLPG